MSTAIRRHGEDIITMNHVITPEGHRFPFAFLEVACWYATEAPGWGYDECVVENEHGRRLSRPEALKISQAWQAKLARENEELRRQRH